MAQVEYFLSHSSADKPTVRRLGAQLILVGADVFYDEWDIEAGESVSGAIEHALDRFDCFLLVWSDAARKSNWVRREYRSAVKRLIEEGKRMICLRLDATPVPRLIDDLKWVDATEGIVGETVDAIMGFSGSASRLKAIQQHLTESGIEFMWNPGYGVIVGCPKCGAGLEFIEHWHQTDYEHDDEYSGFRCERCGWSDGGEI
jgi:hypothetical protein